MHSKKNRLAKQLRSTLKEPLPFMSIFFHLSPECPCCQACWNGHVAWVVAFLISEAPSVYHCCFHLMTFRFLEVTRSTVEPTNFRQNNRKPGPKKISFEKNIEKTHIPWKPNITSPETSHFWVDFVVVSFSLFGGAQKGWFPGSCTTQTHDRGPIPSNAKPFSRSAGFKRRPVDTMEGGLDDGLNPKKCLKNLNRHQPLRTIQDKGRVCVFAFVVFLNRDQQKYKL